MNRQPILCIDDDPNNLALLRQILEQDYELIFARDGESGIEAAIKHEPCLILLDVEMPGMNGLKAAQVLSSIKTLKYTPIIFVTSLNREFDEQKGFDAGAVDYITKPVSAPILQSRIKTHLKLVNASAFQRVQKAAIHMLAEAGHYNDNDTGMHIWRMAEYSERLAFLAGWSSADAKMLRLAAPMHDTGKIGIPDQILKKKGPLSAEEWIIMRQHPTIGFEILSKSEEKIFKLAAEISLCHHEKWTGGGYPNNLEGLQIPESARIVAVADIFDALSIKRPYKDAWPHDKIINELKTLAGNHLEKRLVDLFINDMEHILMIKDHWAKKEAQEVNN